MGYVQEHLLHEEKIAYETQTHWGIFISIKSLLTLGILPLLEKVTSHFAITDKRVMLKTGILSVVSLENSITKVDSIQVEQSLLGRIFGYGTVIVKTAGGNSDGFNYVSNPQEFRQKFNELTLS